MTHRRDSVCRGGRGCGRRAVRWWVDESVDLGFCRDCSPNPGSVIDVYGTGPLGPDEMDAWEVLQS